MKKLPKIIVLLGPTASGKTDLGIALAKKFDGEIISADSRQIYKKMDIGTGKPAGTWKKVGNYKAYMVEGVPHYLMDVVDPDDKFSVADFKEAACARIEDIVRRGKTPFVVGGTGLYIWSLVDNLDFSEAPPNKKLRQKLEKKSLEEMQVLLKKIDLHAYQTIDLKNPRRVIRALEIATARGEDVKQKIPKGSLREKPTPKPLFDVLQIGIQLPREELYERVNKRVELMIAAGWVEETKALMKKKYDVKLPSLSSLGYREIGKYLRGEKSLVETVELIKHATRHYARRQITWFKRDRRISWIDGAKLARAEELVKNFL